MSTTRQRLPRLATPRRPGAPPPETWRGGRWVGRAWFALVIGGALALFLGSWVYVIAVNGRPPRLAVDLVSVVILAAALMHVECARHVESQRRILSRGGPHTNMTSVWTVGAATILPLPLALTVVVVLYAYRWWRVWGPRGGYPVYRAVYSAAMIAVAVSAANVLHWMPLSHADSESWAAAAYILATMAIFWATNLVLICMGLWLHAERSPMLFIRDLRNEIFLELATVALGGVAALLLYVHWPLIALLLPAMIVLHRALLTTDLQADARTDVDTGMATPEWWDTRVERALAQARRRGSLSAILHIEMTELDKIDELYGTGAARAVVRAIGHSVNSVSRAGVDDGSGGEALAARMSAQVMAIHLQHTTEEAVTEMADRIHARAREIVVRTFDRAGSSVEIRDIPLAVGYSLSPAGCTPLDELVVTAEGATEEAKSAGAHRTAGPGGLV